MLSFGINDAPLIGSSEHLTETQIKVHEQVDKELPPYSGKQSTKKMGYQPLREHAKYSSETNRDASK